MAKTLELVGVGGSRWYRAKDGTYNEAWVAESAQATTQGLGQYFYSNDYAIYRFTNYVDTRVIPVGATIVSATITFTLDYNGTSTDFDMVIQLLAPVSSTPDHTWYNKEYFSGDGGSANTAGISGLITIPFNGTGLAWIQKEDYTRLGVRSSRDIAGTQPSGLEYFTYSGYIYYNIIYTAVPAVTTTKSDEVGDTSANIYYTLTNDHDDAHCDKRGVCYNKTGNPTVADDKVEIEGTFSEISNYITALTGLDSGTKYYFKPYCHNPTGYGYGDEGDFTTTGVAAAVTTEAVSQKSYKCAMGNGTVVAGENITERGFEVKLSYSGTFGNYVFHSVAGFEGDVTLVGTVWEGTLVKTESEDGDFSAEAYELVLGYPSVLGNPSYVFSDRLFECESYTYRARATIDSVVHYGDWVAFTTLCYPVGHQDDDTPPIYIPPFVPPEEPIEPIEPFDFPEFPPLVYPEMPNGYWSGMFYYRKAYTKKDLDELRRKCRIFLDNSVEYALVLNHNMRVLQQFLNMMHIYMATDEFNGFKDLIPTQHLNALAHEELDISDFKAIINNFISNSVNNTMNVNNNFRLIRNGLTDYLTTEDAGFTEEKVTTRIVRESDPDVEMLKKKVDVLSREMAQNYATTQHNLYVTRAIIL